MGVPADAVGKRDGVVEGVELVVVEVGCNSRVGEVNGEDTDAIGSCATTGQSAGCEWSGKSGDVLILGALVDYTGGGCQLDLQQHMLGSTPEARQWWYNERAATGGERGGW